MGGVDGKDLLSPLVTDVGYLSLFLPYVHHLWET